MDVSTITSAVLSVVRAYDGGIAQWVAMPLAPGTPVPLPSAPAYVYPGATASLMLLQYVYAVDGSDTAIPGDYDLGVDLIGPGGAPVPGQRIQLVIVPKTSFRKTFNPSERTEVQQGARGPGACLTIILTN